MVFNLKNTLGFFKHRIAMKGHPSKIGIEGGP